MQKVLLTLSLYNNLIVGVSDLVVFWKYEPKQKANALARIIRIAKEVASYESKDPNGKLYFEKTDGSQGPLLTNVVVPEETTTIKVRVLTLTEQAIEDLMHFWSMKDQSDAVNQAISLVCSIKEVVEKDPKGMLFYEYSGGTRHHIIFNRVLV